MQRDNYIATIANAMGKLQRDKYNMTNTICQKNYKCNVTNAMTKYSWRQMQYDKSYMTNVM